MKSGCAFDKSLYAIACILMDPGVDIFLPSRTFVDAQMSLDAWLQFFRPFLRRLSLIFRSGAF